MSHSTSLHLSRVQHQIDNFISRFTHIVRHDILFAGTPSIPTSAYEMRRRNPRAKANGSSSCLWSPSRSQIDARMPGLSLQLGLGTNSRDNKIQCWASDEALTSRYMT